MSYYSEGKLFNDNQTPDTVGLHFFPCHVQEIYFALVEYYTIRYIIQFNNHRSFFPGPQRIHFIAKELVKLEKMRTLINIKCKNYFQRTKNVDVSHTDSFKYNCNAFQIFQVIYRKNSKTKIHEI